MYTVVCVLHNPQFKAEVTIKAVRFVASLLPIKQMHVEISSFAGRREKGAFVIKDLMRGKKLLEVVPRKVEHVARPIQGWLIHREEERAPSPA